MNKNAEELILRCESHFKKSIKIKQDIINERCYVVLVDMAKQISQSIMSGGKLLLCGNGGSAADAQHLAAEMLIRLRPNVNRQGVPAIALAMDSSTITACGNDFGYEMLYQRMVESLGNSGDVLLAITTSGKSKNVNLALAAARAKGISTHGFLGGGGGEALQLCDLAFVVPSNVTGHVQEMHITAGHILMEMIEDLLIQQKYISTY